MKEIIKNLKVERLKVREQRNALDKYIQNSKEASQEDAESLMRLRKAVYQLDFAIHNLERVRRWI